MQFKPIWDFCSLALYFSIIIGRRLETVTSPTKTGIPITSAKYNVVLFRRIYPPVLASQLIEMFNWNEIPDSRTSPFIITATFLSGISFFPASTKKVCYNYKINILYVFYHKQLVAIASLCMKQNTNALVHQNKHVLLIPIEL